MPPPARRGTSLYVRILITFTIALVGFLGFRIFSAIQYAKANPRNTPAAAGKEELRAVRGLLAGASKGTAHGNTDQAKTMATTLSTQMKGMREAFFEGGNDKEMKLSLTGGEFLVYCQLNEDSCAFVIHVPELRHYTDDAKATMAELAYRAAANILNETGNKKVRKLALATRGTLLYDKVLVGEYTHGSESGDKGDATAIAEPVSEKGGAEAPALYPFFAPQSEEAQVPEASAGGTSPKDV